MKMYKRTKFPSGNYWKKILLEIYRYAPNTYGRYTHQTIHPLAKKLKINDLKLNAGREFLEKQELVELTWPDKETKEGFKQGAPYNPQIILTKKGFDVALDLEKHINSVGLQFILIIFTSMLVGTGAIQFITQISAIPSKYILVIYLVFILAGGIIAWIYTRG